MSRIGTITLWLICVAIFVGTVIYGAKYPEARALQMHSGSVFYSVLSMVSLMASVALGFLVLASFFVQFLVSRFGVEEFVKRTGVPPSFLLWRELREEFDRAAKKQAEMADFFKRK